MSDAEEKFMPVVQAINTISDQLTDDHKALVIRLELGYVDYAALEALVQSGIDHMAKRASDLETYYKEVENGQRSEPLPLTKNDLRVAWNNAASQVRTAEALLKVIKRPPPR